jgi:hypothetical protein
MDHRRFGATANVVARLMATAITKLAEIRAFGWVQTARKESVSGGGNKIMLPAPKWLPHLPTILSSGTSAPATPASPASDG